MAKQIVVRLTAEDVAMLEAIQAHSGVLATSEAIRLALRTYVNANALDVKAKKTKAKPRP